MSVKDLSKFKINNSHTLQEYFFNYGRLYYKGKLLKFDISETWAMDPKRRYWEIKDYDGVIRYFEVPYGNKYIHLTRPTYVKHRTAKRWAFGIMLVALLGSCTSFTVGRLLFIGKNIVHPIYSTDFLGIYKHYMDIKSSIDPYNDLSLEELTNAALASSLYQGESASVKDKKMLVVNHGHTITNAILFDVNVDISSFFLKEENGEALEEAISYGSQVVAPKVSKRDYYYPTDTKVNCYSGTASSATKSAWDKKPFKECSKKEYEDEVGKYADNPYTYAINKESILTKEVYDIDPYTKEKHYGNSNKVKNSDGSIDITIDLHNEKGVGRYIKRIKYLSGKDVQFFNNVQLKFHLDVDNEKNLIMRSMSVDETFAVTAMCLKNYNILTSKFYYDDEVPDTIPQASKGENFDYDKYK